MFLFPISISSFKYKTTFFNNNPSKKTILVYLKDREIFLDLEDYVLGVVSAEMPALFDNEALKAQAVASRSFALSKIKNNIIYITSTINDQVYYDNLILSERWKDNYDIYYDKIHKAVKNTAGQAVSRNGKILKTYYFSMSNGKTESSQEVFKENTFDSVDSPYENSSLKNFEYALTISKGDLLNKLGLTSFLINEINRNETNHVKNIEISGKTYTGVEFRKLLNLRSTDFTITNGNEDNLIITTKGYGHGVGMSQYGANEMAKRGNNYQTILKHYYQNIDIVEI